jgi:anti-sigma B factor antagonist
MELSFREVDSALVLSFTDPISIEGDASVLFKERIRRQLDGPGQNLVIDMGLVDFVDSSGLGALISTLKVLRAEGGDLKLANVGEKVRSVLEITRLLRVFETYETAEEAVAALGAGKPAGCPENV